MSNVLVIDTSTNAVSVACGTTNAQASSHNVAQLAFHSENILTAIDEVISEQSSEMADISAIGVGIGPGLFTGLRVGITCAHAFAHALNIPLVYFSSLELTAVSSATTHDWSDVVVARDARRHELYCATYSSIHSAAVAHTIDTTTFSTCLKRSVDECLISPREFVEHVNSLESATIVLDDVTKYEEFAQFSDSARDRIVPALIDARFMVDHVVDSVMAGVVADPFAPSAMYIRKSDAELSWGVPS